MNASFSHTHTPHSLSRNRRHKYRILFVCSGNACRSQIAEAWTNTLYGGQVEAFSAGIEACGLDPNAVEVMAERSIDISSQTSKAFATLRHQPYDLIITLSARAAEYIHSLTLSTPVIHLPCLSPKRRACIGEASLTHYRELRDEIRQAVSRLVLGQTCHRSTAVAIALQT